LCAGRYGYTTEAFNKGEFDLKNDAKKTCVKVYKKIVSKKVDGRGDVGSK
jgi:hypothetical protein